MSDRISLQMYSVYGLTAALVVSMLYGCSVTTNPGDWYRIDPLIAYEKSASVLNCSESYPRVVNAEKKDPGSFNADYVTCQETTATTLPKRNEFFETLLARSEEICGKHLADVMATAGTVGFGTSWMAGIFSALATANPGAAATNYAATSTVINAGGVAFNANIYQGMVTPAIVREIKKSRDSFLANQAVEFKKIPVDQAPASAARRVALQFHESCSFFNGLAQLVAPQGAASAVSVPQATVTTLSR